jgi:phage shock protein PspC (stress-responsive transcriptional regulator)
MLVWKRRPREGMLFGVCSGLARHVRCRPAAIRAAFVLGALLLAGVPILLYALAVLAVPRDDSP